MGIRFKNARILTMEDDKIFDGELWTDGDIISYAGPADGAPNVETDRVIDAGGNIIMPGFKNAHTHSAMTFLRSFADDMPLSEWLTKQVFPMEAKLDAGMIRDLTRLAILEYLTSGQTACFDMYMEPEAVADAAHDMGFRMVLCGAMNDFSQSVRQQAYWFEHFAKDPLVSFILGFHAQYTTSESLLRELSELSHTLCSPIWAHNSETRAEVEKCIGQTGMTPTALMEKLGLFDYGGGGFHCIWMDEGDFEIFERRGLFAVTCPASNLKLASGIAPVEEYVKRGINIAIGTDGSASNNCLDMFREMFLVTGLAKYRYSDASAMDAFTVLRAATVGGARAMGLSDCDTLTAGKKADLIMIDMKRPNMQPENNIVKNIVYSGSKENVALTMVNGRILYEGGKFNNDYDVGAIYARANEIIRSMQK